MERCKDCLYWKQKNSFREDFGECWCEKFVCYEDILSNTVSKDKHIICDDRIIRTNKDFGCIDFKSKAWSLK